MTVADLTQGSPAAALILGLFNLGGGEIILLLALVVIFFGAKKLPGLARGLGEGIWRFRDAMDDVVHDAGRSAGGIYGKGAAQAITPDNQVAELYDPAVLQPAAKPRQQGELPLVRKLWLRLLSWVGLKVQR